MKALEQYFSVVLVGAVRDPMKSVSVTTPLKIAEQYFR